MLYSRIQRLFRDNKLRAEEGKHGLLIFVERPLLVVVEE
jgi:hypothetical protein